jgi:anti-sigma regulatory factor (Ser/Thr protein kinase)
VPETVAAIALCISEAVTNVVMHAYRNATVVGDVELRAYEDEDGCLWFHVRDGGHGLTPRADSPGLGVGLPIISQTASGMAVRTPEEGGTEIVMQFHASGAA